MMTRRKGIVCLVAYGLAVAACGSDDEDAAAARSACEQITDGYAQLWVRCTPTSSLDEAKTLWARNLNCGDQKRIVGNPDACLARLEALPCDRSDTILNECKQILSQ